MILLLLCLLMILLLCVHNTLHTQLRELRRATAPAVTSGILVAQQRNNLRQRMFYSDLHCAARVGGCSRSPFARLQLQLVRAKHIRGRVHDFGAQHAQPGVLSFRSASSSSLSILCTTMTVLVCCCWWCWRCFGWWNNGWCRIVVDGRLWLMMLRLMVHRPSTGVFLMCKRLLQLVKDLI